MTNTTANLTCPPPSSAAHHRSSDMTPLSSVLSLLLLIAIPTLIYAIFFTVKCPPNPFRRRRRSSGGPVGELPTQIGEMELVYSVKYVKEGNGKDQAGECPVCLTALVDGEEVRQLNVCKHSFHDGCIEMWLHSHSSCPVCRASVGGKLSKRPVVDGEDDFRQGLPDSAALV